MADGATIDTAVVPADDDPARLLALGAVKVNEVCQNGARWLTFFDVEGNEFDLIAG